MVTYKVYYYSLVSFKWQTIFYNYRNYVFRLTTVSISSIALECNRIFYFLKECKTTFEGQKSFYSLEDEPICGPCAGIGEEEPI